MIPLPFHSYRLTERSASSARLVNIYAEQNSQDGKTPLLLRGSPGIRLAVTPGTGGPGRGLIPFRSGLLAVAGDRLLSMDSSEMLTDLGELVGTESVYWAAAYDGLVIVNEAGTGYFWNGTSLSIIADTDFTSRNPGPVAFLDNFILVIEKDTGRFFASELANSTSYEALSFATAESSPDNLVTIIEDHGQAILFGTDSIELWYNAGFGNFPFVRVQGGIVALGCGAHRSVVKLDNSVLWMANDGTIRRLNGVTPIRISTHAIEQAIGRYPRIDDCEAFAYTLDGHLCAAFRFVSAGITWIYDATTNAWHERQSNWPLESWQAAGSAQAYGKTWTQNPDTGAIGELSPTIYSEWGNTIRREWTYQSIYDNGRRIQHRSVEIALETGVGPLSGEEPAVRLEMSNDGGRTFINLPERKIGNTGQYLRKIRWSGLGSSEDRVYRASYSAAYPLTVWGTNRE